MYQITKLLANRHIRHGISTAMDGNMSFHFGDKEKVIANRKRFLEEIRIPQERAVFLEVQHANKIIVATGGIAGTGFFSRETAIKADAVATREKNLSLVILTADCIPVIFYDEVHGLIALAHLSRHNTRIGFVQTIVSFLKREYKIEIPKLQVFFGPSISKQSYILPEYPSGFDLSGENLNQLLLKGISEENISIDPTNTARSQDFFSHYRSKRGGEREGRFATAVMLV